MYAAFITPDTFFALTSHHPGGMAGTVLCKLFTGANVAWTAAGSSIVTMVAIATERYYAVVYPLGNKGKLTKRKLKVCYWVDKVKLLATLSFFIINYLIKSTKKKIYHRVLAVQEHKISPSVVSKIEHIGELGLLGRRLQTKKSHRKKDGSQWFSHSRLTHSIVATPTKRKNILSSSTSKIVTMATSKGVKDTLYLSLSG